jgi:hypothetical protein
LCETAPYSARRRREPTSVKTKAWWEVVQRFKTIETASAFVATAVESLAVFESRKMIQRPPLRAEVKPVQVCAAERIVSTITNGAQIARSQ